MSKKISINNYWLKRFDWLYEDETRCFVCGSKHSVEVCHITPKALGGSNDEDNLVLLCHKHHMVAPNTSIDKSIMLNWIEKEYDKYCFLEGFNMKNETLENFSNSYLIFNDMIKNILNEEIYQKFSSKEYFHTLKDKVIFVSSHDRENLIQTLTEINEGFVNNPDILAKFISQYIVSKKNSSANI